MKKKCSYCGQDNDEAATFCGQCGTGEFKATDVSWADSPSTVTIVFALCGLGVLFLLACLLTWSAGIVNPDSPQDTAGKATPWGVIGLSWASVVFLALKLALRVRPKATLYATGAAIVTWVCSGFLFSAMEEKMPVLVFTGYASAATNTGQLANFELRNTSRRAIWLFYSGTGSPLNAPILERPVVVPSITNAQQTNLYSLSVGSFFMGEEELLPGHNRQLQFPLEPGKPAAEVGIYYYTGRLKDGNDFVGSIVRPLLANNASLRAKCAFYWEECKRRFKASKRYEVWCQQPVWYRVSTSDTPTTHPIEPKGD